MEVASALLCDAANLSQEGSLNVLGAFSILYAQEFPHEQPVLSLAMQILVEPEDAGRKCELSIQLVDPDGTLTLDDSLPLEVGVAPEPGGAFRLFDFASFRNVWHPTPGDYELRILLDDNVSSIVRYAVGRL